MPLIIVVMSRWIYGPVNLSRAMYLIDRLRDPAPSWKCFCGESPGHALFPIQRFLPSIFPGRTRPAANPGRRGSKKSSRPPIHSLIQTRIISSVAGAASKGFFPSISISFRTPNSYPNSSPQSLSMIHGKGVILLT